MGKQVTVDYDDLEKIVMATGVVKQLEQIIRQHKQDPFVPKDERAIAISHERIAQEMRRVQRKDSRPEGYDEPLTETEFMTLRAFLGEAPIMGGLCMKDGAVDHRNPVIRGLISRGLLEAGSAFRVTFWGNTQEISKRDLGVFDYRVTLRGEHFMNDYSVNKVVDRKANDDEVKK